jgi:hypothetical protein
MIIEFQCGRDDAVFGVLRNGFRIRGVVQDRRHCALRQSQVFSQFLESGSTVIGWFRVSRHALVTQVSSLPTTLCATQPVFLRGIPPTGEKTAELFLFWEFSAQMGAQMREILKKMCFFVDSLPRQ